jgi:hypothetical protein
MDRRTWSRRVVTVAVAAAAFSSIGAPAFATPEPPTNGGNGAGQSGQCTGPAADRPTSCQSPGGVSDR